MHSRRYVFFCESLIVFAVSITAIISMFNRALSTTDVQLSFEYGAFFVQVHARMHTVLHTACSCARRVACGMAHAACGSWLVARGMLMLRRVAHGALST